jgi:glycosyltransferase involved in cell wall biosynthesis
VNRDQALRILVVISHPWDVRLGAPRVYMELAEQWRVAGHVVEVFSLSDAFPAETGSGAKFLLRQFAFAYKAAAFIRENAARFDVVDALVGDLPFPKEKLRFQGLLVARSVGLPQFYDQFEKSVRQNWGAPARGTLPGRVFYGWARRHRLRASAKALRHADLVNVPNVAESLYVRKERSARSIIVQPYGLTAQRRVELQNGAAAPDARLAEKKVCFIGMWGARKGAYAWPQIITLVRAEIPEARFLFLGTMVEADRIKSALGAAGDRVEVVPQYQPDELPGLVADCTAGAFPSYVEGFGLAVLEQLAAGLPTVAFNIPGPRDVLGADNNDLLVPRGDLPAFAHAIARILRTDPATYRRLVGRSIAAVCDYSWPSIATKTLIAYRTALTELSAPSLLFAQPFSLASPGGGARILRALLEDAPMPAAILCTSPEPPQIRDPARETHLPRRPSFGRIEHSRWHTLPELIMPLFRPSFRRRLRNLCQRRRVLGLHAIPHGGLDFYDSYLVARELGLPYFLQVHDDLIYSGKSRIDLSAASRALRDVWRGAQVRFVISRQMGEEYVRRYGPQEFIIITDGLECIAAAPIESNANELRIYFMGLFHISYEENLRALLHAIARVRAERSALPISVTLRCGQIAARDLAQDKHVRILPFGSEADVAADLQNADLLYLPLPFGAEFEPFVRLSLSTKVVTYLGSGIPILFHGPRAAAVSDLLEENDAAFCHHSLEIDPLAALLIRQLNQPELRRQKAANALALAARDFMLETQRNKFWNAIDPFVSPTRCAPDHSPLDCSA